MSKFEIIIAGSGPAGVFASLAALERGSKVTIIDPGFEFLNYNESIYGENSDKGLLSSDEKERETYYFSNKSDWIESLGNLYYSSSRKNLPPYLKTKNCTLFKSDAKGGLSRIWGRGIEPPYKGEADSWIFSEELDNCFREVLKRVPLSAGNDSLENVFKLYTKNINNMKLSSLSEEFLKNWQKNESILLRKGINFGRTRLAIKDKYMFSSNHLLDRLLKEYPNLKYKKGWKVTSYKNGKKNVKIEIISTDGEKSEVLAKQLILACGAVETTHLVMKSQKIKNTTLKSSDIIVIPFLSARRQKKNQSFENVSELTLTIKNRRVSKKAVVIHLFSKNAILENVFKKFLPKFFMPIINFLVLDRCFVGMCFLHSDDSNDIDVSHSKDKTTFFGGNRFSSYINYLSLLTFFFKNIFTLKLLPLPFIGGPDKPGKSIHYGSSVTIDERGCLAKDSRVFVADGAALPDIPAGSYSLTIMANAYRIGSIVSKTLHDN